MAKETDFSSRMKIHGHKGHRPRSLSNKRDVKFISGFGLFCINIKVRSKNIIISLDGLL